MGFEDDLRPVEEHAAEARRFVQRQKGLIVRLRAAGANTLHAQRVHRLLESNLRRSEEHRDRLGPTCGSKGGGAVTLSDHTAYSRRAASYHQRCCIG
jgi:hypothetical protein